MTATLRLTALAAALRRWVRYGAGAGAATLLAPAAFAGPEGAAVVAGRIDIAHPDARGTVITQGSAAAVIDWRSFDVGGGEYVQFVQPSTGSVVLNRVVGGSPTAILGDLTANGRVFLVNPQGVLFGAGARVDVGGLLATTAGIRNEDFLAGRYRFADATPGATVRNAGRIVAGPDGTGFVVLAGETVDNSGLIAAQLGEVALASGRAFTLDLAGDGLVGFSVDAAAVSDRAGASNAGEITAAGGHVLMTAQVARELLGTVVNQSGTIAATGVAEGPGGVIELVAGGGDLAVSGSADAGSAAGAGGRIEVRSDRDLVMDRGSLLRASGATQGGSVRLIADGLLDTAAGSRVEAAGDPSAGTGGFVELSGHRHVRLDGAVGPGPGGTLLIDPANLTIANRANYNPRNLDQISEEQVEGMLQGSSSLVLAATDSITIQDLDGGSLNGDDSGAGGTLTLAIGTFAGGTITRSAVGSITMLNPANSLVLARGLAAMAGSTAGDVTLGNVFFGSSGAGNVAVVGGNVSIGNVRASADPRPTPGADVGLGVALNASGVLTAGTVTAGDRRRIALDARGAAGVVVGDLGNAQVGSQATPSGLGDVNIVASGGSASLANVRASGSLTVTATGGIVGTDPTLEAAGGVTLASPISVTGGLRVVASAGDVTTRGIDLTGTGGLGVSAAGNIMLGNIATPTSSGLRGLGIDIRSTGPAGRVTVGTASSQEGMFVTAGGRVDFGNVAVAGFTLVSRGADIVLAGGSANGGAPSGDLTLMAATGIRTGNLTGRLVSLSSTNGTIDLGSSRLAATGTLMVTATGGGITGVDPDLSGTTGLRVSGPITVQEGLGLDSTGGDLRTDAISLGAAGTGALAASGGNVSLGDIAYTGPARDLTDANDLAVTARGDLRVGNVTVAGDPARDNASSSFLTLRADGNLAAGDLSVQRLDVSADGAITVGNVAMQTVVTEDFRLTGGINGLGPVTVGSVRSNQNLDVRGQDDVRVGTVFFGDAAGNPTRAGNDLLVRSRGGDVRLAGGALAGTVTLTAAGSLATGGLTAARIVASAAAADGVLTLDGNFSAADIAITANGSLDLASSAVTTPGTLTLAAGRGITGTDPTLAGGTGLTLASPIAVRQGLTLVASDGDIGTGDIGLGADPLVRRGGYALDVQGRDVRTGNVAFTGPARGERFEDDLRFVAGGALTLAGVVATGAASTTSLFAQAGTTLRTGNLALELAGLQAGGDASVGNLAFATARPGLGNLSFLTSTGGAFTAGTLRSDVPVTVTARGRVALDAATVDVSIFSDGLTLRSTAADVRLAGGGTLGGRSELAGATGIATGSLSAGSLFFDAGTGTVAVDDASGTARLSTAFSIDLGNGTVTSAGGLILTAGAGISGRAPSIVTGGDLQLVNVVNAARSLTLVSSGGNVTASELNLGAGGFGALVVEGGNVTLGSVAYTGTAPGLGSDDDLRIAARDRLQLGRLAVAGGDPDGASSSVLTLRAGAGGIQAGDVTAERLDASAGGTVVLGNLALRTRSTDSLDLLASGIVSAGGTVTVGDVTTNQGVRARAPGDVRLGTVVIPGIDSLDARSDAGAVRVAGADVGGTVNLTGATAVTAGALTARAGSIGLTVAGSGGRLAVAGDLTAAAFIDLASAGTVDLAGSVLTAAGSLAIAAADGIAGTDPRLAGAAGVTLSNPIAVQRGLRLLSTGGDVTAGAISYGAGGTGALTVAGGSVALGDLTFADPTAATGADNDITLGARGALTTGSVRLATAAPDTVAITATAGGTLAMRDVDAQSVTLSAPGAISVGALNLRTPDGLDRVGSRVVSTAGTVGIGALSGNPTGFVARSAGALRLDAASVATSLELASTGSSVGLVFANVDGPAVLRAATGIDGGDFTARGLTTRTDAGAQRFDRLTLGAGGLDVTLRNDGGRGFTAGGITVQGDLALDFARRNPGSDLVLGDVAADNVAVTGSGGTLTLGAVTSGNVAVSGAGAVSVGALAATGDATLGSAAGRLVLAGGSVGGTASLQGGPGPGPDIGIVVGGTLVADRLVGRSAGGAQTFGDLRLGAGGADLDGAGGAVTLGNVRSTGPVTLSNLSGSPVFGTLEAAALALTAGGDLDLSHRTLTGSGPVALTAGTLRLDATQLSGGSVTLTAATVLGEQTRFAVDDLQLVAADGLVLGNAVVAGANGGAAARTVALTGALHLLDSTVTAGTVTLTGTQGLEIARSTVATAGPDARFTASAAAGDLRFDNVTIGSGGALSLAAAAGNLVLSGADALTAGGVLSLRAGRGDLRVPDAGSALTGGSVVAEAANVRLGGTAVTATRGDLRLTAAGDVAAGSLTATGAVAVAGGQAAGTTVTVAGVAADGTVTLAGAQVVVTNPLTGSGVAIDAATSIATGGIAVAGLPGGSGRVVLRAGRTVTVDGDVVVDAVAAAATNAAAAGVEIGVFPESAAAALTQVTVNGSLAAPNVRIGRRTGSGAAAGFDVDAIRVTGPITAAGAADGAGALDLVARDAIAAGGALSARQLTYATAGAASLDGAAISADGFDLQAASLAGRGGRIAVTDLTFTVSGGLSLTSTRLGSIDGRAPGTVALTGAGIALDDVTVGGAAVSMTALANDLQLTRSAVSAGSLNLTAAGNLVLGGGDALAVGQRVGLIGTNVLVQGGGNSIDAGALAVRAAGGTADLAAAAVQIQAGAAGFGDDAALVDAIRARAAGLLPPSPVPNVAIAAESVRLGELGIAGGYLFLDAATVTFVDPVTTRAGASRSLAPAALRAAAVEDEPTPLFVNFFRTGPSIRRWCERREDRGVRQLAGHRRHPGRRRHPPARPATRRHQLPVRHPRRDLVRQQHRQQRHRGGGGPRAGRRPQSPAGHRRRLPAPAESERSHRRWRHDAGRQGEAPLGGRRCRLQRGDERQRRHGRPAGRQAGRRRVLQMSREPILKNSLRQLATGLGCGLACAGLVAPATAAPSPPSLPPPAARVTLLTGHGTASDDDGIRELARGDAVYTGSTVHTQADTYLNLLFTDGGAMLLRPNSRLQIDYRFQPPDGTGSPAAPPAGPPVAPATAAPARPPTVGCRLVNLADCRPGDTLPLDGVSFGSGSAAPGAASRTALALLATVLKAAPALLVQVGGHTDDRGDADANRRLSEQRADAVKLYLVNHGVDGRRLFTHGYGAGQPVADNGSEAGRARNRRFELKVLGGTAWEAEPSKGVRVPPPEPAPEAAAVRAARQRLLLADAPAAVGSRAFMTLLKGGFRAVSGAIGKLDREEYRIITPIRTLGIRGTDYLAVLCDEACAYDPEIAARLPAGRSAIGALITTVYKGEIVVGDLDGCPEALATGATDDPRCTVVKTGEVLLSLPEVPPVRLPAQPRFLRLEPVADPLACSG